jgi:L-alanine-DL-glutamate epimerase-like enolase superfamily enzyme
MMRRRQFLNAAFQSAAGLSLGALPLRAIAALGRSARELKITRIEHYPIVPPYHDYNAESLFRYHGRAVQSREIYILKTNSELEGIGESWGGWNSELFQKYIGTSPFDWVGDPTNLPMNMPMYDLMGKFLELPMWKLLGPKVRDWIPVSAWTVSQHPDAMAKEVESVSRRGYRWLKYHIDQIQNVVDQTAAMQQVAPRDFRTHYDFNANSNVEAIYPVLRELEKFPIVGRVEDPIQPTDREGYLLLRQKCKIPILLHHAPPTCMLDGTCDGYMAGHAPIGTAIKTSLIAEGTNIPFMLQNGGGTINQAFLAHQVAVFKMATVDHVNLCHLWKEDVTNEHMPVVGGSVQVPRGPGLGVSINRTKLEELTRVAKPVYRPFLVRIRYAGGPTIYARHDPDQPGSTDDLRYLDRLLAGRNAPGPLPGYANPVVSNFLGPRTAGFQELWRKTADGPYVIPDAE